MALSKKLRAFAKELAAEIGERGAAMPPKERMRRHRQMMAVVQKRRRAKQNPAR